MYSVQRTKTLKTDLMKKARRNLFNLFVVFVSTLFLSNCKDSVPQKPMTEIRRNAGVFVANEGTFTFGNASLYYINLTNDSLSSHTDIFKPANGRPLGDILQSMALIDELLWLVVNNSGKIEIVDPKSGISVKTIRGLRSPRYALEVSPTKVYVTDLYSQAIHIIDPKSFSVTGSIACGGWTEELILHEGKVWISNHDRDYLYMIDPEKDQITDSIKVAYGGSSLLKDKNGMLWLLCSGDEIKKKTGGLFGIDPRDKKIMRSWLFDNAGFNPVKLKQSPANDSLYFIFKGVYGFAKTTAQLPTHAFIPQPSGSSFYGLAVNPSTGDLLIADALDYQSRGYVRICNAAGVMRSKYQVGVIPGEFLFW